ncbi:MAG: carboxypeptidase regulatory-like domain-containing protein [Saprospiraceae bacterium]|nr:carboxypeptidase regulatory-like domain-containing protein [Saprospiraceae bacterium]
MNKVLTLIYVLFHLCTTIPENSTIEGKVTDLKGEPLLFSTVALYQNGVVVKGVETDMDGNYFLSGIKPGTYDMEASYCWLCTSKQDKQEQQSQFSTSGTNRVQVLNFRILCHSTKLNRCILERSTPRPPPSRRVKASLVETDCTTSGSTTSDKIRKLPTKSVHAVAATSAGISGREGSDISVRGSRSEETVYFLDGVRVVAGTKDPKIPEEKGQAGLVTAGEWNDLNNWEKWAELLKKDEFKNMNTFWGVHTEHRYPVFVTNENYDPISGISVFLRMIKIVSFGVPSRIYMVVLNFSIYLNTHLKNLSYIIITVTQKIK